MAKIDQVQNGDTGLNARTKLNEAIKDVESDASLTGDGINTPLSVDFSGAPVQSVAGKTGDVTLDTGDVTEVTDKNYVTDAEKTSIGTIGDKVTGPPTAVDSNLAIFDGTTGKIIKDSLLALAKVLTTNGGQTVDGDMTINGILNLLGNAILANSVSLNGISPRIDFIETDDANTWRILQDSGQLQFRLNNTSPYVFILPKDGLPPRFQLGLRSFSDATGTGSQVPNNGVFADWNIGITQQSITGAVSYPLTNSLLVSFIESNNRGFQILSGGVNSTDGFYFRRVHSSYAGGTPGFSEWTELAQKNNVLPKLAEQKEESGATYTILDDDTGKTIYFTNVGGCTVTLPNSSPVGTQVVVWKDAAGDVVLSAEGTLKSEGTTLATQNTSAVITKRDATTWQAAGKLT